MTTAKELPKWPRWVLYKHCRRIVVYRGPDVVNPSPGQWYPVRRGLEEIATLMPASSRYQLFGDDGKISLRSLLQRRSKSLLQRKYNVGHSWEDTETPWLQYATQGRFLELNILQLMELTASSKCSDPRDKVFGLLGMIQEGHGVPIPDYTLSMSHVLTEVAAYCVLDARCPELFYNAAGDEAHHQSPSWMPAWTQDLSLGDTAPARKWFSVPSATERSFDEAILEMAYFGGTLDKFPFAPMEHKAMEKMDFGGVHSLFSGVKGRHKQWQVLQGLPKDDRESDDKTPSAVAASTNTSSDRVKSGPDLIGAYLAQIHPKLQPQRHEHPEKSQASLSLRVAACDREAIGIYGYGAQIPWGLSSVFPQWGYVSEVSDRSACGGESSLPRQDCRFSASPRWPQKLLDAFGISGSVFRVTIS
ncbi:hypothetical protein B0T24DRAFT_592927 [Lasiosphaeria ovina]|uniref:Uncharacterized protein n=1 Tax=Lasiosphaeria ovina TaxID=92902 RepID=A0AAE0KIM9_9PEZI|nr:hypothetical protein B0T24DRAFT_592927 [Lasiosphaeria ovina]